MARQRLTDLAETTVTWYDEFADSFEGAAGGAQPAPQASPMTAWSARFVTSSLSSMTQKLAEAVRILWTAGHLLVVQHLEMSVIDASRVANALWSPNALALPGGLRRSPRFVA